MTPAERQLVADLFDRLATLEDAPRDPDAERVIRDGLNQAPNAIYALVQTALVQDEALRRANTRLQELEGAAGSTGEPQRRGFLDNVRDGLFGRRDEARGSVPSVRPGAPFGSPPGYANAAQPMGAPPGYGAAPGYGGQMQEPSRGGSFLGTAAAAAAGVIGGSLLLDGIRSMGGMGGGHRNGFGLTDPAAAGGHSGGSPWGGGGGGNDDLARSLGRDDIGRTGGTSAANQSGQGLFGDGDSDRSGKSGNDDLSDTENFGNEDTDDDFGTDDGGGFDSGGGDND